MASSTSTTENVSEEKSNQYKITQDMENTANANETCCHNSTTLKTDNLQSCVSNVPADQGHRPALEDSSVAEENILCNIEHLGITDKKESQVIVNIPSNSLRSLMSYNSSNDNSENNSEDEDESSSEDSESDSTASTTSDDSSGDCENEDLPSSKNRSQKSNAPYNVTDILDPVDFSLLPDLEKLDINYGNEEFLHVGLVKNIILDTVVTVEALPGIPAFDLDTVLFLKKNTDDREWQPVGVVDDVIGPVDAPLYCLRFKSADDLKGIGIAVGSDVYVAPKNKCTKYVFVKELLKIKGTDASWVGDKELPPEMMEESDDEIQNETDTPRKPCKRKIQKNTSEPSYFEPRQPRMPYRHSLYCPPPFVYNMPPPPSGYNTPPSPSAYNIPPPPPPFISGAEYGPIRGNYVGIRPPPIFPPHVARGFGRPFPRPFMGPYQH